MKSKKVLIITDCSPVPRPVYLYRAMSLYTSFKDKRLILPLAEKLSHKNELFFLCENSLTKQYLQKKGFSSNNKFDYLTGKELKESGCAVLPAVETWIESQKFKDENYRNIVCALKAELVNLMSVTIQLLDSLERVIATVEPDVIYVESKNSPEDILLKKALKTRIEIKYILPNFLSEIKKQGERTGRGLFNIRRNLKIEYNITKKTGNKAAEEKTLLFYGPGINSFNAILPVIIESSKSLPQHAIHAVHPVGIRENSTDQLRNEKFSLSKQLFKNTLADIFMALALTKKIRLKKGISVYHKNYNLGPALEMMIDRYMMFQFQLTGWNYNKLKKALAEIDVALLIVGNDRAQVGSIVSMIQKNNKGRSFSVQDGIYFNDPHTNYVNADFIAVTGTMSKKYLIQNNVSSERIKVTGQAKYDYMKQFGSNQKKTDYFQKNFNIPFKKKTILYTTIKLKDTYEKLMMTKAIFKAMQDNPDAQLVIKVHPYDDEGFYKDLVREFSMDVPVVKDWDILELIYNCDIMITKHSTTVLEAMALGINVIILNLSGKEDSAPFVREGGAFGVYDADSLKETIEMIVKDNYDHREVAMRRERFIERYLYKTDGMASSRIVTCLDNIMSN